MLQFRKRTKLYTLYIYMFFFPQAFVQKKLRKTIYMSTLHFRKKYDKNIENNKNEDQGAKTLLKPNTGRNTYLQ